MTTILEDEIRSQGDVLRQRADVSMQQATIAAANWHDVAYALVAARGSSDNAALFFQYLAGRELGLVVALATPSLFQGDSVMRVRDAGVLAISQSGRSPGMADVLRLARSGHCPTLVVTNDATSELAVVADSVIELFAGAERALASTKTFTSSCHALAQFVAALRGGPLDGLDSLPDDIDRVTQWALATTLPVEDFDVASGLTVVGRGIGYAAAKEISIKIREVTGIRSEPYAAPDFLHGPIGADGAGATLLLVVTDEVTDDVAASVLEQSRARGMRTIVLRSSERSRQLCDAEIEVCESLSNWSLGLAFVVVGQVLALRLGEQKGRPIDTSPGLNKVTLTA
jgi:glucosamine--fructose-6-phosphate aminotransferase (isomerizing)